MSVRPRLQKAPIQVEVIDLNESELEEDLLPEGNEILDDGDESESDDDNISIYEDALTAMDNEGRGDGTYQVCPGSTRSQIWQPTRSKMHANRKKAWPTAKGYGRLEKWNSWKKQCWQMQSPPRNCAPPLASSYLTS